MWQNDNTKLVSTKGKRDLHDTGVAMNVSLVSPLILKVLRKIEFKVQEIEPVKREQETISKSLYAILAAKHLHHYPSNPSE